MNTATIADAIPSAPSAPDSRPHFDSKPSLVTILLFVGLLIGGVVFTTMSLTTDVQETGINATS